MRHPWYSAVSSPHAFSTSFWLGPCKGSSFNRGQPCVIHLGGCSKCMGVGVKDSATTGVRSPLPQAESIKALHSINAKRRLLSVHVLASRVLQLCELLLQCRHLLIIPNLPVLGVLLR